MCVQVKEDGYAEPGVDQKPSTEQHPETVDGAAGQSYWPLSGVLTVFVC